MPAIIARELVFIEGLYPGVINFEVAYAVRNLNAERKSARFSRSKLVRPHRGYAPAYPPLPTGGDRFVQRGMTAVDGSRPPPRKPCPDAVDEER